MELFWPELCDSEINRFTMCGSDIFETLGRVLRLKIEIMDFKKAVLIEVEQQVRNGRGRGMK